MEDYKVVWEMVDGSKGCSEWTTEKNARKKFSEMREHHKCVWAELIYSPLDDNSIDEEQVIDSFTKDRHDYGFFGTLLIDRGRR